MLKTGEVLIMLIMLILGFQKSGQNKGNVNHVFNHVSLLGTYGGRGAPKGTKD